MQQNNTITVEEMGAEWGVILSQTLAKASASTKQKDVVIGQLEKEIEKLEEEIERLHMVISKMKAEK